MGELNGAERSELTEQRNVSLAGKAGRKSRCRRGSCSSYLILWFSECWSSQAEVLRRSGVKPKLHRRFYCPG